MVSPNISRHRSAARGIRLDLRVRLVRLYVRASSPVRGTADGRAAARFVRRYRVSATRYLPWRVSQRHQFWSDGKKKYMGGLPERVGSRPWPASKNVWWCAEWFGGRESIFWISHTNEFCGKSKVAHECRVAGSVHQSARRVCESGWHSRATDRPHRTPYHILQIFVAWSFEQACRLRSR